MLFEDPKQDCMPCCGQVTWPPVAKLHIVALSYGVEMLTGMQGLTLKASILPDTFSIASFKAKT